MKFIIVNIIFFHLITCIFANLQLITDSHDVEEQKMNIIAEIVLGNLKNNGWNNIMVLGSLPNILYNRLKVIPFTFAISNINSYDTQIENAVPYHSNFIIMSCGDIEELEMAIKKIITFPYWHPLGNIILYYHASYNKDVLAKIFFIYWFYRAVNVVIIQFDDINKEMMISYFSPYISDTYKLSQIYGCWTAKKLGMQIGQFEKSFICDTHCHNVTSYSKLRALHLGTCIGLDTEIVALEDWTRIQHLKLFEDKAKNFKGYTFYAFAIEVLPFFRITPYDNGTFTFHQRDGMIWNTMAELFNFKIDISPSLKDVKEKFDFKLNIGYVFSYSLRKADLILFPLYQFDLILAEVDYTVPFIDSGVCILSHRAGFETIVFDVNVVEKNISIIIEFLICLVCMWFVFFIYNTEQIGRLSSDQAGKDFSNTIKTVLSISLHKPPKRGSFRIFLTITLWSFFVINFSLQAAIISLFSVQKRDKEVDTFADIVNKGYNIEGIATPDIVLPETEDLFRILSSRMKTMIDLFACVNTMQNDSRRFCLIDCALGRYLVKNMINDKGEQFLHLASDARIHSHYLNMILHKHSPLTEHFNKYITMFFEAGLIRKWMEYKYFDFKDEATIKPLAMEDLGGIFNCYGMLLGISCLVFLFEVIFGLIYKMKRKCEIHSLNINCKNKICAKFVTKEV